MKNETVGISGALEAILTRINEAYVRDILPVPLPPPFPDEGEDDDNDEEEEGANGSKNE